MVFQLLRITVIVFLSTLLLAGCGRQAGSVDPGLDADIITSDEEAEAGMGGEMGNEGALSEADILAERALAAEEQARQEEALRQAEMAQRTQMAEAAFVNEDVHFAFDSFLLNAEAERILGQKAVWLQDNGGVGVQIEGHCDERGTSNYNLALGEYRANAVQQYLTMLGIDPARLSTISYGEARPLDLGHNEAAWSRNRRAHFVITRR
jgi:peptidoglycan-associated lipoprotein